MIINSEDTDQIYWEVEPNKENDNATFTLTALAVMALMEANRDKQIATKAIKYLGRNRQTEY